MKANEPKGSELSKLTKWLKSKPEPQTKSGIILTKEEHKSYLDYLKKSEYNENYKQFAKENFLFQYNERRQRKSEVEHWHDNPL